MLALTVHGPGDLRVEERGHARGDPEEGVEVRIALGGICGSDLHYFHHGRVGERIVREPLVLGHELVGTVIRSWSGDGAVSWALPAAGARVAIDPSRPCGLCAPCRGAAANRCERPLFLGSAASLPHTQGGFSELLVVHPDQCVPIPDGVPLQSAVFAEPLAVALHALQRAGPIAGSALLVTGAGPIGALIAALAHREGAAQVTATDLHARPLALLRKLAPVRTLNVAQSSSLPAVDLAIEASGSSAGLRDCLSSTRPGGRVVAVGMFSGDGVALDANALIATEIELLGSFRFSHAEFRAALARIAEGFDPRPLLTDSFPLADGLLAFEAASRRERSMKVQLQIAPA